MTTALILHPTANPIPGTYHRHTSNWPPVGNLICEHFRQWPLDPALKDWDQPHWDIYQNHDGSVEVHACRPTDAETREGDLLGALGSIITVHANSRTRTSLRTALRIARVLCNCDPAAGAILHYLDYLNVKSIETDLPLKYWFPVEFANFVREPTNIIART